MMKAIVVTSFGGPEVMKYTDLDIPSISEDQVLIRVVATSVNFADIKSRYGKKEIKHYLLFRIDATGIVERVGSHVKNIHPDNVSLLFLKMDLTQNTLLQMKILLSYYPMKLTFKLQPLVQSYLLQAIIYSQCCKASTR